ncbi:DUF4174 domain-containing protein [Maritimibacter sp. DP1N21-5]|uniref:DUF4174 domain-containing protein n=1 Tax=Maritimibacter sp. DP1N21-5 TaxID=2836867 RepID=UPI001C45D918|nr:DUF4174 domain-containing protein [Maritimibacter sp. DP1N21-5]MBV7409083.1 DUF4174 domain-containing protein [Maritimibacter sp. DP1N21-5]
MIRSFMLALTGAAALAAIGPGAMAAQDMVELPVIEAGEHTLDEFLWEARPLVIFADSELDPNFVEQMERLAERPEDLAVRDVVVIVDTDPAARSPIRTELRPRGFDLVLIGKDGQKYLRKPTPWDIREISRSIDKMPIRLREMQDRRLVR